MKGVTGFGTTKSCQMVLEGFRSTLIELPRGKMKDVPDLQVRLW
jgi:hypothetical protein